VVTNFELFANLMVLSKLIPKSPPAVDEQKSKGNLKVKVKIA